MNMYYAKKKYKESFYDSHTYNSYSDETKSFIRKEFFSINRSTLLNIAELYRKLYGVKPYSYLLEAYDLWKRGERRVSDQTMERILKCVPKFLSKEKKLIILKSEIIQFIGTKQKRCQFRTIGCKEIDSLYMEFYNSIEKFDHKELRWFVKDVFTKEEIDKYIEISKYVIRRKLEQSYIQVKSDLIFLYPIINKFAVGIEKQDYIIDFFGVNLLLDSFQENAMKLEKKIIEEPKLDDNFNAEMLSYLVEEILQITYIEEKSEFEQELSQKDLSLLLNKYIDLLEKDKDADLSSKFRGKGGIFKIRITLKSKKKLYIKLFVSIIKSIAFFLGFLIIIFLLIYFSLFSKLGIFSLIILLASIYLLLLAYNEFGESKSTRMEIINYGRR